jgi:glycosyltransferase involved in cell wall biosynthesis
VTGVLSEEELDAAYHAADVLLHASTHEGWGLSVLEAMASGDSVVVSIGEPFDEYLDPVCATFVDPGSAVSIARGIDRACRRRDEVAAAAQARAKSYDWGTSASRHVALYESLLGEVTPARRASDGDGKIS